ncbi:MAG: virulence protein RhuM/Fic/DOC family protein [Patescibacteria group bacterium]
MSRKKKIQEDAQTIIYQAKSGAIELRGDFRAETIWATQAQIADVFDIERSVVTRHIQNVLRTKEVGQKSNVQKIHIPYSDKPVAIYSLDIMLAVGYRANSSRAMIFRKWATKTLREHITKGYTINPGVVKKNYAEFQKAVENIKRLLPVGGQVSGTDALELISAFADTWLSLDAYDKDTLRTKGVTKKDVTLTADMLEKEIAGFKDSLIKRGEATELFGQEKQSGAINGIVGNVMQSFGGKEMYGTVEEKAAHILYFVVKNHPFNDGNKRSGAYAFVWFLRKAGVLRRDRMSPAALTALTLFVAESDPTHKDRIVHLILQLLGK